MPDNMQIAIIIVNWNNYPDTSICLDSLSKLERVNYQVVVVDNGSLDGSLELIRKNYPDVILLESGENLGFAGGNNIGINYALKNGFRYILLLNNDTEVKQGDFLSLLMKDLEADDQIAAIGPRVSTPAGDPEKTILPYPSFGNTLKNTLGFYQPDMNNRQRVDSLTGCCVLIRSEAINSVGLLDDHYFMYAEETEWFYRMRRAGWVLIYSPIDSILHKGGSSSKRIDSQKIYIERRANVIYTLVKGKHKFQAGLTAFLMLILLGGRIVKSWFFQQKDSRYPLRMLLDQLSAFWEKWVLAAKKIPS